MTGLAEQQLPKIKFSVCARRKSQHPAQGHTLRDAQSRTVASRGLILPVYAPSEIYTSIRVPIDMPGWRTEAERKASVACAALFSLLNLLLTDSNELLDLADNQLKKTTPSGATLHFMRQIQLCKLPDYLDPNNPFLLMAADSESDAHRLDLDLYGDYPSSDIVVLS